MTGIKIKEDALTFDCEDCNGIFEAYEMNRVRVIVEEDEHGDISMNVDRCLECATAMQDMKGIEEADGNIVPVIRVEVTSWVGKLNLEALA